MYTQVQKVHTSTVYIESVKKKDLIFFNPRHTLHSLISLSGEPRNAYLNGLYGEVRLAGQGVVFGLFVQDMFMQRRGENDPSFFAQ